MLQMFRGYIPYTDEEKKDLWEKCIFVFDTNFLLNLYRYSIETRERFFTILENLKGNIWLPNQVAEEYFKNRCKVLFNQHQVYEKITKEASFSSMKTLLKEYEDRHSLIDTKKILAIVDEAEAKIKKLIENIEYKDKDIPYNNDTICRKLLKLFDGKVGNPYTDDKLKELYSKGEERFKKKIPPGYKDDKKEGNDKYGDFIIWEQIKDYAKNGKTPIFFVTGDKKEDWWNVLGGKTIGPQIKLTQEFFLETEMDFYMYQPKQFLEEASTKYGIPEKGLEQAITEVETLNIYNKLVNINIFEKNIVNRNSKMRSYCNMRDFKNYKCEFEVEFDLSKQMSDSVIKLFQKHLNQKLKQSVKIFSYYQLNDTLCVTVICRGNSEEDLAKIKRKVINTVDYINTVI